jgi:transcription elongation factor Elf1
MRVTITCEECGHKHRLERRITEPGPIWIICHNCELPLQAVLEGPTPRQVHAAYAVWKDILNLSDVGTAS